MLQFERALAGLSVHTHADVAGGRGRRVVEKLEAVAVPRVKPFIYELTAGVKLDIPKSGDRRAGGGIGHIGRERSGSCGFERSGRGRKRELIRERVRKAARGETSYRRNP